LIKSIIDIPAKQLIYAINSSGSRPSPMTVLSEVP
jgi:hypothetical protein